MYASKKQALLIKVETTRQTAETLAAANAIDAQNVRISFPLKNIRREVFKRSFGGARHANINRYAAIDFDYILRVTNEPGEGSSSKKEVYDPVLRGCGLTPAYTAESGGGVNDGNITYTFAQAPTETVTIGFYVDGIYYQIRGAVGDLTIRMPTGEFAMLQCHFEGFYTATAATAIPADIEDAFPTLAALPCFGFSYFPDGIFTALKGLYLFGPDVTEDFSGNANTLTNNNTVLPYDATVRGIGAAFTAASSMSLSRAYDADFNLGTGNFTIFGWFMHGDTAGGAVYILDRTDSSGIGPEVYLDTNGKIVARISDDGAAFDTITSGTAYDDGLWHFFLYQRSGTALTLRVDDVADGSATATNAASSISGTTPILNIGRKRTGANYFNGKLLWIGIAAEAMGSAQIRTDMYRWVHDHLSQELEIKLGNQITRRIAEDGITDFRITGRDPKGMLKIYHPALADRDFYSEVLQNNPALILLQRKIGVATVNTQVIVKARAQFDNMQPDFSQKLAYQSLPFGLYETDGNINDQLSLILR